MKSERAIGKSFLGGVLAAIGAYGIWGTLSLYWALTVGADPLETLSHRIVWSVFFVFAVLLLMGKGGELLQTVRQFREQKHQTTLIVLATLFASVNWLVNILAVVTERVVELGIGTFLTSLMTVALGALVFKEKLSKAKIIALMLAFIGVMNLIVGLDRFPTIALLVSSTWAVYGALKKQVRLDPWISIAIEHALMFFPALAFLLYLHASGGSHFGVSGGWILTVALMGTGIVTSVPMILFSVAAQRLPLTALGVAQYLSPILTTILGATVFGETISNAEMVTLALIFCAILLFVGPPVFQKAARMLDRAGQ